MMTTKFLQLPDGKIAYDDTGSGLLVLLVPGMGVLRSEFRFLSPQLVSAGLRVISMDLRGHGETSPKWTNYSVPEMGRDILAMIRHLDAGPIVLVGHSFSAASAVWAATESPEWVRGLVLIGPAVRGNPGVAIRLLMKTLFARPWGSSAWIKYYSTLFPTRKPADWAAYTSTLQQNLAQPGRLESLRQLMLESKAPATERLQQIDLPALVIMGSKDGDFKDPTGEARWIAQQVKGAYKIVEGAGHYPHTEMPEITGRVVREFIEKLPLKEAYAETAL